MTHAEVKNSIKHKSASRAKSKSGDKNKHSVKGNNNIKKAVGEVNSLTQLEKIKHTAAAKNTLRLWMQNHTEQGN